jgi:cytochrome c553
MCASCHFKHHHGTEADYAIKLFELYGLKHMQQLRETSKQEKIWTRDDYNNLITLYKKQRDNLLV